MWDRPPPSELLPRRGEFASSPNGITGWSSAIQWRIQNGRFRRADLYPRYMSKVNAHYERIDPPKQSEKLRSGGRFDCNVHCQSAFSTDRPPQRGFSLRFGGQSVHNAHLLCSCTWGTCLVEWSKLSKVPKIQNSFIFAGQLYYALL